MYLHRKKTPKCISKENKMYGNAMWYQHLAGLDSEQMHYPSLATPK